ncbi:hypothetical protein B0T26DRAFT_428926 [Lasiosphaeria miniovina]|uniref:Uncharacterized protein n=1 Tax=Lasiosphaeria miniovina TaxID=1954250 RepID=A0AA40A697_9PEZI|nr:uncharacterized protein B0T26DRAFT_428926 [Lasiosphaeria miniovina]KAK0709933.1 hypothetical protein B0T26DRAFT_428926 [Lasiosphaeria miniovina]
MARYVCRRSSTEFPFTRGKHKWMQEGKRRVGHKWRGTSVPKLGSEAHPHNSTAIFRPRQV